VTFTINIDYPYAELPEEVYIYFYPDFKDKQPFVSLTWITPDGRKFNLGNMAISTGSVYMFTRDISQTYFFPGIRRSTIYMAGEGGFPVTCTVFFDPAKKETCAALPGTYTLRIDGTTFEPDSTIQANVVVMGRVYGWAGTDYYRRDLSVGLLWGLPIALALGLVGAVVTTILSMLVAAGGVWFGGWTDALVQRITEANMVLPVLAIGVMVYYYYGISLWAILGVVILLNVFGSTTKAYRAAFIQVKEAAYIEAAQAYGASHSRMILQYMVPRILPVLIPQLVALIPAYVFLEATLGIFAVGDPFIPTWGSIIHDALKNMAFRANYYWIAEPVALLLITGLAFAMFGFALDRILNPRLRDS
jgi:peptide/nickel transport system permease protein